MTKIIDADGHIVEPRNFWQEYIEPSYRERLPRITKDSNRQQRLCSGRNVYTGRPGNAGVDAQAFMGRSAAGQLRPASSSQGHGLRGNQRLRLFPSIGIGFVGIKDPELSAAGRRAYNNWMADSCRNAPERPTVWPRFRSMMLRSRSRRCAGWSRTTA